MAPIGALAVVPVATALPAHAGKRADCRRACGSVHDKDTRYSWADAFALEIVALNTPPCFTGRCDWRLPNRRELESMVDVGAVDPAVSPAFDTACAPGCTVLTCACTVSGYYWSSSTLRARLTAGWLVNFSDGYVGGDFKSGSNYVRAVRGGS